MEIESIRPFLPLGRKGFSLSKNQIMYVAFQNLSESSRIWVYQADRKLSEKELELAKSELKTFCE